MRLQVLIFGLLTCLSAAAAAMAPAVVDSVQAPAWVDRGERTLPLAPGFELRSGDVVRTGAGARAYLILAEGSTVKLGESARFVLYTRSLRPDSLFRGALDIAAGAFRFTTDTLRRARSQRDLTIRVATATVGIRGTDVWGRADPDRDLVALIEGRIELTRGGESIDLQPMTFMDAPRGSPAEVKVLEPALFRGLARETEIESGDGAHRSRGKWAVAAGDFETQEEALGRYDQLRDAGFAVRITPRAQTQGEASGWRYAVRLPGFASDADARAAAARIKAAAGGSATAVIGS
jgi:hypothetical protein